MSAVMNLADPVAQALSELAAEHDVSYEATANGGAIVTIHEFEFGERWEPLVGDLRFELLYSYPFAAIYPYFGPATLTRVDGGPRPAALQVVDWRGSSHTQISLRSTRWDPQIDSASRALIQVAHWFREPPS